MDNPRKYGNAPFHVAVLHGGPGGPGYMAPVARELSRTFGVLEPLQTKDSVEGQVEELHAHLLSAGSPHFTLIGSSWGAMLSLFFSARYPELVAKLILIGIGVFDAQSAEKVRALRKERMSPETLAKYQSLAEELKSAPDSEKNGVLKRLAAVTFDVDVCEPLTRDFETIEVQGALHDKVWADYVKLRDEPGRLREEFQKIKALTAGT